MKLIESGAVHGGLCALHLHDLLYLNDAVLHAGNHIAPLVFAQLGNLHLLVILEPCTYSFAPTHSTSLTKPAT